MAADTDSIVPLSEVRSFVNRCMVSVGTNPEHADILAELLMTADHRGHYSHGINRLGVYSDEVNIGIAANDGEPVILNETPAIAHVSGENLLGPYVGKFCMDLAIKKAKEVGIGCVVAKGSNHFGIAGWYSIRASEQGLIGMSFTNTSPCVAPIRARKAIIGTNPIAVAAPGNNGDSFELDMATSTVAFGKVEMSDLKGTTLPDGWGVDSVGKVTHDPKEILNGGALSPLGGTEECGGYKGYGMALMVEVMCGLLSGSSFGPHIRKWKSNTEGAADLGHCFIAVDPNAFEPGFTDRMSSLMDTCRNAEPAEGETEVLVPGDPERSHMAKCDTLGGIPYHANQIEHLRELAQTLGVEEMKILQ